MSVAETIGVRTNFQNCFTAEYRTSRDWHTFSTDGLTLNELSKCPNSPYDVLNYNELRNLNSYASLRASGVKSVYSTFITVVLPLSGIVPTLLSKNCCCILRPLFYGHEEILR